MYYAMFTADPMTAFLNKEQTAYTKLDFTLRDTDLELLQRKVDLHKSNPQILAVMVWEQGKEPLLHEIRDFDGQWQSVER